MKPYQFADRMNGIKPSAIREILKSTQDPKVISFAAGSPASEAFPVKEIENITKMILSDNPIAALNYSISEGYTPLRKAISNFIKDREGAIVTTDDDVIVVSGGQQGIELATKCFVNDGDVVLVEDPTFANAINTFRTYHAELVGIPMEPDGPNIAKLEEALTTHKNIKMFYTIPNFQNPTGYTMSMEKRQAVYRLCASHGVMILEDNPYGDLRYSGTSIPSIKSLDTQGVVIYVGSFSKIIAPGMRIGYVVANKDIMSPMVVAKQCSDVHSNILAQMVCERFLATGNIPSHMNTLQKIYRQKKNLMMEHLQENCGMISFTQPEGGLFIWATLPNNMDSLMFCKKAAEMGVAVVPGNPFYVDETAPCSTFRINYSTPTTKQIIEGCQRLGALTRELLRY